MARLVEGGEVGGYEEEARVVRELGRDAVLRFFVLRRYRRGGGRWFGGYSSDDAWDENVVVLE